MTGVDPDKVASVIQEVADQHILPYFRQLTAEQISFKIGDDPVTIADHEAESALSARLLDLLPGSKVVGEEAFSANQGVLEALFSESPVWIIDPVDGTRNFVKGSHEFGVIVALAKQNQTIAGWIYDPTSTEIVTAEFGSGAFYKRQRLKTLPSKPLQQMQGFLGDRLVTACENKASVLKETVSPQFTMMSAGAHEYPRLVLNQPHFGKDVPQSHFRASHSHSNPWDDAAGVLIHAEAGGYARHWTGEAYRPSAIHKGLALAPDRDSWNELKAWCSAFTVLPA